MWPGTNLANAVMNSNNTAQGGFIGSRMYTVTLPSLLTTIRNAFGSTHVTAMQVNYPDAFEGSTGKATRSSNYSVYITLPTECQIYGAPIWSDIGFEMGFESTQLSLFRYNKRIANSNFWLRNVAKHNNYATHFCLSGSFSLANYTDANQSFGARPLFVLS